MDYSQLISTISIISDNEGFCKENLTLSYVLNEYDFGKMVREIYQNATNKMVDSIPETEFEVQIGEILIKFSKKLA